jgi:hypothetical protein
VFRRDKELSIIPGVHLMAVRNLSTTKTRRKVIKHFDTIYVCFGLEMVHTCDFRVDRLL